MIPTIKIKSENHEQGFYLINQEDFDESQHQVYFELTPEQVQAIADQKAADDKAAADKLAQEEAQAVKAAAPVVKRR